MKTAERILVTSLALFNQHGEANVSSVDIALELDISPGNLYYHFKGKEVIVSALYELYSEQMSKLLRAADRHPLSLEDFFYFLYLLLEKGQLFQFLFHNPADLLDKYPALAKPFRQQLAQQERCILGLLEGFAAQGQLDVSRAQCQQMMELIGLVYTQSASYAALKGQNTQDEIQVYRALASILFAILPHMRLPEGELHHLQDAIAGQSLAVADVWRELEA
ncbi:TetR/AcrR family transcriptional regulator [Aestuariibacter halophilus]|uniref:TetR/AcrR family transcriptional regulator n=1 Tax=Fluctibacter halophilus TaxID=226011 RepID=A0ABS8G6S0_9ALTE|nr:TetR/AcrR family transcriptional regulator [Aestuariibacter halophilus]MCC2616223.1 TetR/AcrR family transcriptional regulator [Aestuariibacter halophilus]